MGTFRLRPNGIRACRRRARERIFFSFGEVSIVYRMASDVASLDDHIKELVNPIFVELRTALKVTDPKLFGETYASPPRTPHTPATTPSFQITHSAICCDKKSRKIQRTRERAKREATAQSRVYLRPAFDVLWIRVAQRLCCIELGQRARFFGHPQRGRENCQGEGEMPIAIVQHLARNRRRR